jgi:hypothetical protein
VALLNAVMLTALLAHDANPQLLPALPSRAFNVLLLVFSSPVAFFVIPSLLVRPMTGGVLPGNYLLAWMSCLVNAGIWGLIATGIAAFVTRKQEAEQRRAW